MINFLYYSKFLTHPRSLPDTSGRGVRRTGRVIFYNQISIEFKLIIFIIVTILVSCTQRSNWDTQINWERLDINTLPASDQYPNSGAIILHDEAKIETFGDEDDGWTMYSRHRIVKIFDIRGHQYANMAVPFSPGNEIEDLQARTISPSGKITIVNPNNIYDISLYPNFMLYSDQRAKLFTFPAIENNSVVEYRYNVRYKRHNFGNSWTFQDNIPVLFSKFEINIPSESEPVYKLSGIKIEPTIKKAPKGFKSKYTWEVQDMPAMESEIGMPARKHMLARLNIASVSTKSWKDVGDWYRRLSKSQMIVSEELKNLVLDITHRKVENSEKLKAIYQWVIENIRYISVSIGIGSYQPHLADEIFLNRYGDCKDMSTLLCTMAKEANIDVYPVIISTWQNGNVDSSIVSVGQFNHLIAYCPSLGENGIWMDATDNACQYGALPWYDQGRLVLVVTEDSSVFKLTPKLKYLSNRTKMEWQVDLESDGSAKIKGENRSWGAQANDLRYDLLIKSEKDKNIWMEKMIAEKCIFSKLDSMSISGTNPIKDPLIINYTFSTERFTNKVDNDLIFCPGDISSFNLSDYFMEEERAYPVQFKFGMQKQVNLTINIPKDWQVKTEGEDKNIKSDFGEASWRWYTRDNKLHIRNLFILNGDGVDPIDYPEFKSFLKEIKLQELKQVVLTKE